MKSKTLFYNLIGFLFCALLHTATNNWYFFIAPLFEELAKYLSAIDEKHMDIIYSYSTFGIIEFIFYVIMYPTLYVYLERLIPLLFHIITGAVTMYLDKRNKRPYSYPINVFLHYIAIFVH